jgi:CDP-diacylglycerol--serine O-phosphatidyltransferase
MALLFIVIGAVFDFFDGMVARLLHVSSPIGKELDSLADDITFGFAPSAIIFSYLAQFSILNSQLIYCSGSSSGRSDIYRS